MKYLWKARENTGSLGLSCRHSRQCSLAMARERRPGKSPKGDDGAGKKKKRRLSTAVEVLRDPNNDDVERASTPTRSSATPSRRRKPRRSLVGSTNWEADLGDIYRTCIQLGTQNVSTLPTHPCVAPFLACGFVQPQLLPQLLGSLALGVCWLLHEVRSADVHHRKSAPRTPGTCACLTTSTMCLTLRTLQARRRPRPAAPSLVTHWSRVSVTSSWLVTRWIPL